MRYLILSDIHSNWEALRAVLADATGRYDEVLCLGDLVGYGADPNPVVEWARNNVTAIVRGNHDKVAAGSEGLEWFNQVAQKGALWTRDELSEANLEYIRSLPEGPIEVDEFQIVHGTPLDEDAYLVGPNDAAQLSGYLDTPVTFFGHTHLQGGFQLHRNGMRQIDPLLLEESGADLELAADMYHLINPGSVGQPRDHDPRAAYAIYTPSERLLTYRRAEYDVIAAQQKILDAGLPEMLAERLAFGR